MPSNSKFTRDDDGNIAVRVVSNTGVSEQPESMFTTDEDGNVAVRVVYGTGGGGGDSHNKGYFADLEALQEAYPTAEAGDWAIVGSTDTVWIWDTDNSEWVDSDQKGQVTSVNNQTGAVTIKTINNNELVGSGNVELSTYLTYPNTWTTNSTTKAFCDIIAADTTATVGKAYLGEVTFSDLPASMVNGEVVVEIMSGTTSANKVIVLSLKSGNVSPYAWQYVYWNGGTNTSGWKTFGDTLPSQTGNSGKFLTTDGTNTSWGAALVNKATGTDSVVIESTYTNKTNSIKIGKNAAGGDYCVTVGAASSSSTVNNYTTSVGYAAGCTAEYATAIGSRARARANYAIQLGSMQTETSNTDANTFKVANSNGNFEIMSANGTIPADRLVNSINKYSTMPTASADNLGWVVQYTGTTDSTYTHGYIYECVSDGGNPATYSWTAVEVQAGGSSLPSQTGNSGKFLTTDGTDASWGDALALSGGTMTGDIQFNYSTSTTSSSKGVFFYNTSTGEQVKITVKYSNSTSYLKLWKWEMSGWGDGYSLYVPESTTSSTYGKIGTETHPVLRANVKYIKGVNGSDIEVPTTGGTMAVIGVNTTITLASANWSSNSQTVNVTGITATGIVFVSPDPTDQSAYTSAGITCSAQGAGTLTFTCDTTPSADIDVNVVCL